MNSNPQSSTSEATDSPEVLNLAAYKFASLDQLPTLRKELKTLCYRLELKGTVMLSEEGINLFVAGAPESVQALVDRLQLVPGLGDLVGKQSFTSKQPFHRMLVKIKKEIIAFGIDAVRPKERTSPKIQAATLRQWLDEGRPIKLLDVRNDYEIKLGTFHGAIDLGLKHFRHFPEVVAQWNEEAKKEPVVMFCTGGIRCEKAGPYMEQLGFENIYQLDGGILKYFEECGSDHYDGGCFVFDQRVAVGPDLKPTGDAMCFACQASLLQSELDSPEYVPGVSCPYCYRSSEEWTSSRLQNRQAKIQSIASGLPGCIPYDNHRPIHVPKRFVGKSLIDFLAERFPNHPAEQWIQEIDSGRILHETQKLTPDYIVREGECFDHIEPDCVEPPVATNIQLLIEEEGFLVVDKPAPLPAHPSGRFNKNTLQAFLMEAYRPQVIRLVHRLDANTSGLMLLARTYRSARAFQKQFERLDIGKEYLARVHGDPIEEEFECEAPISRKADRSGARQVDEDGFASKTRFVVLKRFGDGTSLLKAMPQTGRTNQIRVHLWSLGYPIVGDPLYLEGGRQGEQGTSGVEAAPMALHASELSFFHPETLERIVVRSSAVPSWAE